MTSANIEAFIILQYSNGVGHLVRCSAIAKSLSSISHVTLLSGGTPIEGYSAPSAVDFVQLPALRWDFVAGASPQPDRSGMTLARTEQMRSEILVEHYLRTRPQIVITEWFPFAPERFGETLNALFDVISKERKKPIVLCSIRSTPSAKMWNSRTDPAWVNRQLRDHFSGVLHHVDAKLIPLAALGSYERTALSGVPVWQTGFVRRPSTRTDYGRPSNGLLLTVGGGSAVGARLLRRWVKAARAGSPELFPINAVCGPQMDAGDRKDVRAEQAANIAVHDRVDNLDELIGSSRAIVCLAGYNTLVEALSLGKPVLAFPNNELGDQPFQLNALHSQGMLLRADQSQSEHEITALMNDLINFRPQHPIDYNGANRSVEIVRHLLSNS
jgi:predicted glycosyltransferase